MKIRVWVRQSRIAGKGLFAAQDITQDIRILPYIGPKISKILSIGRATRHYKTQK